MSMIFELFILSYSLFWLLEKADYDHRQELIACLIFIFGILIGGAA